MTNGRIGDMKEITGGQKQRAAYYEDYAKPVLVNWPFMLVAAATLFLVGHFANRGSGRRLGRDNKKRLPSKDDSSRNPDSNGGAEGSVGHRRNQPVSLAELRALRAEAAESRFQSGASSSNVPGAAKPTPLGVILTLARKVDSLEDEANVFLGTLKTEERLDANGEKEQSRLLELLTQVQLDIDGVQSDESVRPHRRTQTNRVQKIILALEGIGKQSS